MVSRQSGQPYEGMERDPCPSAGYPLVKRRPNPESEFRETYWPKSKIRVIQMIKKGRAQELFKLTNEDMCDLYHRRTEGPAKGQDRIVIWKLYFKIECERRAWEIHGGPDGLAYAQRNRDWNRAYRARASGSTTKDVAGRTGHSIASPQKSRPNPMRPKSLRLETSNHDDDDRGRIQEADVHSENDSSQELIPLSTPQRKKLTRVFGSTSKIRHNVDGQDSSMLTPQKKPKMSTKGTTDDEVPFQLPTPAPTAKKSGLFSAKALTPEDVLHLQRSDDRERLPSLLPIKRSMSDDSQSVPTTPLKKDTELKALPTPSSSQKGWLSRGRTQQQRVNVGTLDCEWDSEHEVRVRWLS